MGVKVKESLQVSPYLLWFLVHGSQTGVGMLSFQRKVAGGAGQDAWVSLLLVGLLFHLLLWMMFKLLSYSEGGDILSLHREYFGKWAAVMIAGWFYVYGLLVVAVQIKSYGEIIQVWIFPDQPLWVITALILLVCAYIVSGGFRTVTGISFFGVIIPSFLVLSLYFPLKYAHWNNFLPMLNHDAGDYLLSARHTLYIYLGAEFILLYLPFIKNPKQAQKWAHLGIAHTTFIYLIVLVVTFAYFNLQLLQHTVWPTLILSKIIRLFFLYRFDYVYVFTWFIVIVPTCCIILWSIVHAMKQISGRPARLWLWISVLIVGVIVQLERSPVSLQKLEALTAAAGSLFILCYLPLLFVWISIIRAYKRRLTK